MRSHEKFLIINLLRRRKAMLNKLLPSSVRCRWSLPLSPLRSVHKLPFCVWHCLQSIDNWNISGDAMEEHTNATNECVSAAAVAHWKRKLVKRDFRWKRKAKTKIYTLLEIKMYLLLLLLLLVIWCAIFRIAISARPTVIGVPHHLLCRRQ